MKYSLLILSLCFTICCSAQSNYKPGYVVTVKGDTLKGFVQYRESFSNPKVLSFKTNLSLQSGQRFAPNEIKSAIIKGVIEYESAIVNVSNSNTDISQIETLLDTTYRVDTVFLTVLQKGENIRLYSYQDDKKIRFYYAEAGSHLVYELNYYVYQDPASNTLVYLRPFREQLANEAYHYRPQDKNLDSKIKAVDYKQNDLIALAAAINNQNNIKLQDQQANILNFYVGASINFSQLKFGKGDGGAFPYGNSANNVGPGVSFGLQNIFDKNSQHFAAGLEISASYNNFQIAETPYSDSETASIKVNVLSAALSPYFLYNVYVSQPAKIFIAAGARLNLSKYSDLLYRQTFSGISHIDRTDFPAFRSYWTAAFAKAGVTLNNRVQAFAEYRLSGNVTNDGNESAKFNSISFGANYLF